MAAKVILFKLMKAVSKTNFQEIASEIQSHLLNLEI